ncbi:hypothetical protein ACOSQ3_009858 [Xanthoceras sorbifolium]
MERTFKYKDLLTNMLIHLRKFTMRHRNTSDVTIGELIALRLRHCNGRIMRSKDIIVEMKEMFSVQLMYSKAHTGLNYVLTLTYGSSTELYQLLSFYCYVLQKQNLGTIINMKIEPDSKFMYFFMVVGASLRGFYNFMLSMIVRTIVHISLKRSSYTSTPENDMSRCTIKK